MKKLGKLKWLLPLAAVLMLLGGLAACSDGGDDNPPISGPVVTPTPVATLSVTPDKAVLAVGGQTKLKATFGSEDVTEKATWTSDNSGIATVGKGTVKGVAKGSTKISVLYNSKTVEVSVSVFDTTVPEASNKVYYTKQDEAVAEVVPEVTVAEGGARSFNIYEKYTSTSNRYKSGMGNGNNKTMIVYAPSKMSGDFSIAAKVQTRDSVGSSGGTNGIGIGMTTGFKNEDAFAYELWGSDGCTKLFYSKDDATVEQDKTNQMTGNNFGAAITLDMTVSRIGDTLAWTWTDGTKSGAASMKVADIVSGSKKLTGDVYPVLVCSRVDATVLGLQIVDLKEYKTVFDLTQAGSEVVKMNPATLSVSPAGTQYVELGKSVELTVTSTKESAVADEAADWKAKSSDDSIVTVTKSGTKATLTASATKAGTTTVTFENSSDPSLKVVVTVAAVNYPSTNAVNLTAAYAYPAAGATDAYNNGELSLTFDEEPVLVSTGYVMIYKADGTLVDQIKFADEKQQLSEKVAVAVANQLARVEGKTAYFTPHNSLLQENTAYYVAIPQAAITTKAGGIPKIGGVEFSGLSVAPNKEKAWTFTTKANPDKTKTEITVDKDASKNPDYRSIQAALTAIGDQTGNFKIKVAKGTYYELLYYDFAGKANVEIEGQTTTKYGADVVVSFANAGALSSANNTEQTRCLFEFRGGNLILENIYLKNTFLRGNYKDATQAEALGVDSGKANYTAAYNCGFYSHQDTIRTIGKAWFYDCYIAGDVDFIWQETTGITLLVENSKIETLGDDTNAAYITAPGASQAEPIGKGTVILNADVQLGVESWFARTPWATGRASQSAMINSTFTKKNDKGSLNVQLYKGKSCEDNIPDYLVGWKDYNNKWADGTAITASDADRTALGSAALTKEFYEKEYNGRRAILNRYYKAGAFTKDTTTYWDVDALITAQGWNVAADTSKEVAEGDAVSSDIVFDFGTFVVTETKTVEVNGKSATYMPNGVVVNKVYALGNNGATATIKVNGNCYVDVSYCYSGEGTITPGSQNAVPFAASASVGQTDITDTTTVTNYSGATDIVIAFTGTTYLTAVTVRYDDKIVAPSYEVKLDDFAEESVTLDLNGTKTVTKTVAATGKDAKDAKITYSIDNTAVAEVDAATGLVTAKAIGEAKVSAKENLLGGIKQYTLHVKNTAAPAKNFNISLNEIKGAAGDYGTFAAAGGSWHDNQHGWYWGKDGTLSIPVAGSSKITLTGCTYLTVAPVVATAKKADGTAINWTETVDSVQGCDKTYSFKYKGGEAAIVTLTFGNQTYCPLVQVEEYVAPTYEVKLSYATAQVEYDLNSTTLSGTNPLTITGASDKAKVTYSSSHPDVASVDAATGLVTAKAMGRTEIKALEETGETATYIVLVKNTGAVPPTYMLNFMSGDLFDGYANTLDYGLVSINPGNKNAYAYKGTQHGAQFKDGNSVVLKVAGAAKISLGGCQYSGDTLPVVTTAAGATLTTTATSAKTAKCYDADGSTIDWNYEGTEATTITIAFGNSVYVPVIIVKGPTAQTSDLVLDWTASTSDVETTWKNSQTDSTWNGVKVHAFSDTTLAADGSGLNLGGIFAIGSNSSTATTADSTPGGDIVFKKGYNIKVTVGYSFTKSNTDGKSLIVLLDNNTSKAANSIQGSNSKVKTESFDMATAAKTGSFDVVIDCSSMKDDEKGHFISLRRESAVTANITSVKIEYVAAN